MDSLLNVLLFLPLIVGVALLMLPWLEDKDVRWVSVAAGGLMLLLSLVIAGSFNPHIMQLQFITNKQWITNPFPVNYFVGLDGFSLALVVLTTIITFVSLLASYTIKHRVRLYYSLVFLLTFSILGVFMSQDLLQFFIMYEFELVPMYFLIAIWGGPRRGYAAMKFLIYTFLGGVFMFAGLLYTYMQLYAMSPAAATFDMPTLATVANSLPREVQVLACLGFFLAFIIKLPSVPFHTWLPDAHVEAPTPISMILAGLLLKMGSYGLVRICMGFFPAFWGEFAPWVLVLGAVNILWGAIACLVQNDMKRIIAYSSVSHMGFILLGIGSLSNAAVNGAIFQMLSHGFISAMLFFLVGCVYERCHTRLLNELGGGLAFGMPVLFYFWMFATMANLGLPALSGFVGEVTCFYGAFTSPVATQGAAAVMVKGWIAAACVGVVLTAGYMLWLLKRLFYGQEIAKWKGHLWDCTLTERIVGATLAVLILAYGVYPIWLTTWYGRIGDRITASVVNRSQISLKKNDKPLAPIATIGDGTRL